MFEHLKKIDITEKDDEFYELIKAENKFWKDAFVSCYGVIIIAGVCHKHILEKLLESGMANYEERKKTLMDKLGDAWLNSVSAHFDKHWLEIVDYQKYDTKNLKAKLAYLF